MPGFGQNPSEWQISWVLSHSGQGKEAIFKVQWSTGDLTWVPQVELESLAVLDKYLEAMGVSCMKDLPATMPKTPSISVSVMKIALKLSSGHHSYIANTRLKPKMEGRTNYLTAATAENPMSITVKK